MRSKTERIEYLDLLRIVSMLFVIVAHTSGYLAEAEPEGSRLRLVYMACDNTAFAAVPIFTMISGVLWLGRYNGDWRTLFRKNLKRIITAFLFWSFLYDILQTIIGPLFIDPTMTQPSAAGFLSFLVIGRYHLWYCYLIAGLYLLIPVFSVLAGNKRLFCYFTLLILLSSAFLEDIRSLLGWIKAVDIVIANANFVVGSVYTFYFCAGFCADKVRLAGWKKWVVYCMTVLSFLYCEIMRTFRSDAPFIHTMMAVGSLLLFLSVKTLSEDWKKRHTEHVEPAWLIRLSDSCFGIYLIHEFGAWASYTVDKNMYLNPAMNVALRSIVIFIVSAGIVCGIRRISPKLSKYIT